jgi:hypothetical protein
MVVIIEAKAAIIIPIMATAINTWTNDPPR